MWETEEELFCLRVREILRVPGERGGRPDPGCDAGANSPRISHRIWRSLRNVCLWTRHCVWLDSGRVRHWMEESDADHPLRLRRPQEDGRHPDDTSQTPGGLGQRGMDGKRKRNYYRHQNHGFLKFVLMYQEKDNIKYLYFMKHTIKSIYTRTTTSLS